MPTYRIPILVWQDFQGLYTASMLEWEGPAGIGKTRRAARTQLAEFLQWSYRENPFQASPDFLDPQIRSFRVPVRTEYSLENRHYPSDEPVSLRLFGVHGRQQGGLQICSLPTLDIRFYYYASDSLEELVSHYVQQQLKGITPQALSRRLPPPQVELDEIVLRVPPGFTDTGFEPGAKLLASVAEPLGDPRIRKQFGHAWQRDAEVLNLVHRLGRQRASVVLVGEPGAGKTTVLAEAIRTLERLAEDTPAEEAEPRSPGLPARNRRRYWLTSGPRLIAGMKYLGQWEERCENIIAELSALDGVLCVENLLDLIRAGGRDPAESVAAFMLPYLERGELRLVSEATPAEFDACRRLLPGLAAALQVLNLPEMRGKQAQTVLAQLAADLAKNLKLPLDEDVIPRVYHLFQRFSPYHAFPGQAAAFVKELFERARKQKSAVTSELALDAFVRWSGLPELFLRDEVPLVQDEVVAAFRRQVIGQDDACQAAAALVTTFKSGLNDPRRPIGVLLFCGPTGVGKTELAKAVSRYFFGHGEQAQRLIRLDMSEYAGPAAAQRLMMNPSGEPSDLISKVRSQPFVVVLLDEIEKASPEVFDLFLSLFDEGRLTDRFGRTTTFRSAVLVMTSNLGASQRRSLGFGPAAAVRYDAAARAFFRPEFFNRLDAVVSFQPLDRAAIEAITRKELGEIAVREGLERRRLRLSWTDALVAFLAREGFDPSYGARPLQRTIDSRVVAPLASYLLEHPNLENQELRLDVNAAEQVEVSVL